MGSQEIHPFMLQSRHPAIEPQGWHWLPFWNIPTRQMQVEVDRVKLLVVSQMVHVAASVHLRQPG